MRETRAESDATSVTHETRAFLIARAQGRKLAVPDSVWHGNDRWVLETGARGWKLSERGEELLAYLSAELARVPSTITAKQ